MAFEIANKIVSGRKEVDVADTAEPLVATEIFCYRVDLSADLNNANHVVVGNKDVVATPGAIVGTILVPGNPPHTILTNEVAKIWVNATDAGDAICFTYYQP